MPSRVTITSVDGKFAPKQLLSIRKLSDRQLYIIAKETERTIREQIKASLQRPGSTGNLANSFYAERIGISGWGIGNVSYLNSNAPYWRWINYGVAGTGRKVPPSSMGAFSPGDPAPSGNQFRKGRFQQNSGAGGGFLMIPTKAIEPHNYIAGTLFQIQSIISSALKGVKL